MKNQLFQSKFKLSYLNYLVFKFLFIGSLSASAQHHSKDLLYKYFEQHQFVKMDSLNRSIPNNSNYHFYKAAYANACNNPKVSNTFLEGIKRGSFKNSLDYLRIKNDNYVKMFDYSRAYKTSRKIVSKFKKELSAEELKDQINNNLIWDILKKQPAQKMEAFDEVKVATVKDLAGLITTKVEAGDYENNFVFDTGAGLNCITETEAKKFGVTRISDKKITVVSFTGQETEVPLGIAKELTIGTVKISNVIFLIYPDEAFSFANGKYVINGIIGFPIIKDLGTITIEKNQLTFSKKEQLVNNDKNLFVNQLRAIVLLKYKGQTLPFNFDSGAKRSLLSKSFYDRYTNEINSIGESKSRKSAGAGGQEIEKEVIELKNQEFWLLSQKINVPVIEVDKNDYGIYGQMNFGNIGQDILGQYNKISISFTNNYLKLE